ncbi:hypothetical protein BGZ80_010889, partial [Entomortierella chlamydospora]
MNLSIFDIRLLKEDVAQYLSSGDLARCTLVSKKWRAYFTSVLWRHPFDNDFKHKKTAKIARYKDYIRSIEGSRLGGDQARESIFKLSFPTLKSLKIDIPESAQPDYKMNLLQFIEANTTLQILDLSITEYRGEVRERLVSILQSHPHLQEFSLLTRQKVHHIYIQDIIEACSRFATLKLDCFRRNSTKELESPVDAKDRPAQMGDTNIRDLLILPSFPDDESAILVPLLKRCPLLEKLTLKELKESTVKDVAEVLKKFTAKAGLYFMPDDFAKIAPLLQEQWVCKDLTSLDLEFAIPGALKSVRHRDWKGSMADQCLTWVFEQVGQLAKLRNFEVEGGRDLISHYKHNLAGLKQLRSLKFGNWEGNRRYAASRGDAEWMIENMPRLIEIVVTDNIFESQEKMDYIASGLASFIKEFKKRKPLVQKTTNIARYKDYIRSIEGSRLGGDQARESIFKLSFPTLKSLKIDIPGSAQPDYKMNLLQFIEANTTLQILDLSITEYRGEVRERLVSILQSHPHLQEFSLLTRQQVHRAHTEDIIEACSRFVTLKLDLSRKNVIGEDLEKAVEPKTRSTQMSEDTNIRELFIRSSFPYIEPTILIRLLRRCPLLEKLTLKGLSESTVGYIAKALRRGWCPLLSDLTTADLVDHRNGKEGFEKLLISIGHTTDAAGGTDEDGRRGIVTFIEDSTQLDSVPWIPVLAQHHHRTLTRLDLKMLTKFNVLTDVVLHFPQLQELKVRTVLHVIPEEFVKTYPSLRKQWACKDLTNLRLEFAIPNAFQNVEEGWKGSEEDHCLTWVFEQVGQLSRLRNFEVEGSRDLIPQYKHNLTGLKQLRSLKFEAYEINSRFAVGHDDADWMIENMPRLIEVVIIDHIPESQDKTNYVSEGPASFMEEFKERKPWAQ